MVQLHYRQYGTGHPLIILHGLLGSSGNWHTLSSKVFGERFSVYAVDQRNHGRSPHSDTFDYPTMAGDLRGFMEQQGLASAHLLGHSMGGMTAMFFALEHPEMVDRLVVADMAPKAYPPTHTGILDAISGLNLATYNSRRQIDDALSQRIKSPGVRQFLLKNLAYEDGRYSWQINVDGIVRNYDNLSVAPPEGRTFDRPALFIRGTESDYISEDDRERIVQYFPQARLVAIEAGHWIHADAPDAFARVVMDFLAS